MADLYVSHAGDDDNDGAIATPWKTLNRAVVAMSGGDIVHLVNDSEYTLVTEASGTCEMVDVSVFSKIVDVGAFTESLEYYQSGKFFFNNNATLLDDGGGYNVFSKPDNDTIILNYPTATRNITASGGVTTIPYYFSTDMPAITLNLDNTGGDIATDVWLTIKAADSASKPTITTAATTFGATGINGFWWVGDNNYKIKNIIFEITALVDDAYCINNSTESATKEGLYIYGCEFSGFRDSIHSHIIRTVIENNIVHYMSDSMSHAYAFAINGRDSSILFNDISGNQNTVAYSNQCGGIVVITDATGVIIYGNVIHDFPAAAIGAGPNFTGLITITGEVSLLANNVCYNLTATSTTNGWDAGILLYPLTASPASIDIMFNNIVDNCRNGLYVYTGGKILSGGYNCISNNSIANYTGISAYSDDISTTPQFNDAANGDFSLLPVSPCKNMGKPTLNSGYTTIGAYQFSQDGILTYGRNPN